MSRRRPDPLDPPDAPPGGWGPDDEPTLADLKHGARQTAERQHGHELGPWSEDPTTASASCLKCAHVVAVNADPAPNGIQVSGRAVAVDCPHKEP